MKMPEVLKKKTRWRVMTIKMKIETMKLMFYIKIERMKIMIYKVDEARWAFYSTVCYQWHSDLFLGLLLSLFRFYWEFGRLVIGNWKIIISSPDACALLPGDLGRERWKGWRTTDCWSFSLYSGWGICWCFCSCPFHWHWWLRRQRCPIAEAILCTLGQHTLLVWGLNSSVLLLCFLSLPLPLSLPLSLS